MANGQQIGEEHYQAFLTWAASKTDDDFKEYVYRGQLKRSEIISESGIGESSIRQNPKIKKALKGLEDSLRERGVLPPLKDSPQEPAKAPLRDRTAVQNSRDKQRLNALEQQNAALKAKVAQLEAKLEEVSAFDDFLMETGRLPN